VAVNLLPFGQLTVRRVEWTQNGRGTIVLANPSGTTVTIESTQLPDDIHVRPGATVTLVLGYDK